MPETTNALTQKKKHRPLSNRMRPVIFPPLILDVSAKWEVKSQIWDVTFGLPPCLLPPSLPTPLHPLLVLFGTSLFDCISPPPQHDAHLGDGCVWACWVNGFYTEHGAFSLSVEHLVWAWSNGNLRDWQRADEVRRRDWGDNRDAASKSLDWIFPVRPCYPNLYPFIWKSQIQVLVKNSLSHWLCFDFHLSNPLELQM